VVITQAPTTLARGCRPGIRYYPAAASADAVSWIEPRGNVVRKQTLSGLNVSNPTFLAGMGSPWVRGFGGDVYRFEAATLKPLGVYPADPSTGGFMALGFGSLWVSNLDSDSVWRVRVQG
jgi:hypothetical protein